eukprot:TRINITY_DN23376_c0_g1_i1.p1 TRINITY_DN23376_c0_g1~~TRINITY_DN23376_c0_g1_i1.p1  ORF type:complete len:966 (+),score=127.12 TRINITY_DN23376_c0_g1_i1:50-2947(+)
MAVVASAGLEAICASDCGREIGSCAGRSLEAASLRVDELNESLHASAAAARSLGFTVDALERCTACALEASFEDLVQLTRSALGALLLEDADDDFRSTVSQYVGHMAARRPLDITFALGSFLASSSSTLTSRWRPPDRIALLLSCRAWLEAGAVRSSVSTLLGGDTATRSLPLEAKALCIRWLCSMVDFVAPLCEGMQMYDVAVWSEEYPEKLVSALLSEWYAQHHSRTCDDKCAVDLCSSLVMRGEANRLAAYLCATCLQCTTLVHCGNDVLDFASSLIEKLAIERVSCACSLVLALLDACTAVLQMQNFSDGSVQLVANDTRASRLLSSLLSACLSTGLRGAAIKSNAILHLLVERLWRLSRSSQLSAAVIFAVVDVLQEKDTWQETFLSWLERWADACMLKSADLESERTLALRVARSLRYAKRLDAVATQLVLRGIHIRLNAAVPQSRWFGMAVAEFFARTMSRSSRDDCDTSDHASAVLCFEGFDLKTCELEEFLACDEDFKIRERLPDAGNDPRVGLDSKGPAATVLRRLLSDASKDDAVVEHEAAKVRGASNASKNSFEHLRDSTDSERERGMSATPQQAVALHDNVESDSDDEDDPIRAFDSLPPLDTPTDHFEDLRLVQPPRLLQSAYEMLLGPAKDQELGTALARGPEETVADDPSRPATSEPPSVARARIQASLSSLPALVEENPPELSRLAIPLGSRLLHIAGDTLGSKDADRLRHASLVALLTSARSRREIVKFLIDECGSEDMALATRLLILDVLSNAARVLSGMERSRIENNHANVGESLTFPAQVSPKAAPDAQGVACSKTRRFASATKVPQSRPNLFAGELRFFLFPLVSRWHGPTGGMVRWVANEHLLIGSWLQCLGVLLECAGQACPERDVAAYRCLEVVQELLGHAEPYVRRCALFLLSRVLLVGADEQVWRFARLPAELPSRLLCEGDEPCRKMLHGIMTWLHL